MINMKKQYNIGDLISYKYGGDFDIKHGIVSKVVRWGDYEAYYAFVIGSGKLISRAFEVFILKEAIIE